MADSLATRLQVPYLRLHQYLYLRTGGLVGHHMVGVPSLLLHTVGRRSGAPRVTALIYAVDGRDYVVVASNNGQDQPPGWLYNLRDRPEVEVQVGRRRLRGTGRVVEPGDDDYARRWQLVNARNHGRYDRYQAKTTRPIPLVVITPA